MFKKLFLLAAFTVLCLARCAPTSQRVAATPRAPAPLAPGQPLENGEGGGAQDPGGGNVTLSTEDEVRAAVEKARALFLKPRSGFDFDPLFYQFRQLADPKMSDFLRSLDSSMNLPEFNHELSRKTPPESHRVSDYLKLSKIVLQDGPCKGLSSSDNDAAVSDHKIGADICFSISRLRRFPANALANAIVPLFAHEITHLNGYGEKEATAVQQFFADNYSKIFFGTGSKTKEKFRQLADQNIDDVYQLYFGLCNSSFHSLRLYSFDVERFQNTINTRTQVIDDFFTTIGADMDPIVQPAHPDLMRESFFLVNFDGAIVNLQMLLLKRPSADEIRKSIKVLYDLLKDYAKNLERALYEVGDPADVAHDPDKYGIDLSGAQEDCNFSVEKQ